MASSSTARVRLASREAGHDLQKKIRYQTLLHNDVWNGGKKHLLHILLRAIRLLLKDCFLNTLGLLPSMGDGGNEPVGE